MCLRTLFISILLGLLLHVQGQQIRVISSSDRRPIEHVAVFNPTRERAAITDSLGQIDLSFFLPSDTIYFQHPSYETAILIKYELRVDLVMLERKRIQIEEYVISASKHVERKLFVPNMVGVLEEKHLRESTGMTAADILEGTGNIMVQRTQGGGGSPILRGFEANKILLVVDGIRLNNAIYRSGHLQNSITIDHSMLERTEVIYGPSSVIYGSDALGGVVHYYTRDPELSPDSVFLFRTRAYVQYASANQGWVAHADFSLGKQKWGSITSVTFKELGDIRMGARRGPGLGDWGKRMHYVDQVNGVDSTLVNEDPLIQKNTGYSQMDLIQKFRYSPSPHVDWILNMQLSTSSDIDRLDKLNDYAGSNLKYAAHYYGPQNRALIALRNTIKKETPFFTNMTAIAAYQRIDEDRFSRQFRNEELLTQVEDVHVVSFNLDLFKAWDTDHILNYGADFSYNLVNSQAWYENIFTGSQVPAQTRYPGGGSRTWSTSSYASYKWRLSEKFLLNGGARYNLGTLFSRFDDNRLPFDRIEIRHGALTGSAGMVYTPSESWQINAMLSTGFRNPNVDDYGKVRAKDGDITVPSESLLPEYSYNGEFGIRLNLQPYLQLELVGYYTLLKNAIVRTDTEINGEDSLFYDGDYYNIITNYNAGRASIYGGSLGLRSSPFRHLSVSGTLNYTRGYNFSDDVPLGHIPPLFGRTSIAYRRDRYFVEGWVAYQGWKHPENFSPYGEDNEGEAMEEGFPAWWTMNLKGGISVGNHLDFMLAIENLFDQFYKAYASGVSAPGRNFILTARFIL